MAMTLSVALSMREGSSCSDEALRVKEELSEGAPTMKGRVWKRTLRDWVLISVCMVAVERI